MKYSPDAYLLHESSRFITFNIRVKVVMKEPVAPAVLKAAAEKAFGRFPYYSKQIHIDEEGGIDLIPNPRTIRVNPFLQSGPTFFPRKSITSPAALNMRETTSTSICITGCVVAAAHSCGSRLPFTSISAPAMVCARSRVLPL